MTDTNYYQVIEGRPYRPSNGCEGDWFMNKWCARCTKQDPGHIGCQIIAGSMAYSLKDPEYPKELRCEHLPEGFDAWCTAFIAASPRRAGKEG